MVSVTGEKSEWKSGFRVVRDKLDRQNFMFRSNLKFYVRTKLKITIIRLQISFRLRQFFAALKVEINF